MVQRWPVKPDITGSNPVPRATFFGDYMYCEFCGRKLKREEDRLNMRVRYVCPKYSTWYLFRVDFRHSYLLGEPLDFKNYDQVTGERLADDSNS